MPKVLVVGDEIKDIYKWGKVTRVCPEAPVPVFVCESIEVRKGGAALVAANLKALGIEVDTMYAGDGRASEKTRYMVGHHMLLREDMDAHGKLFAWSREGLIRKVKESDAVIISDYDKGAVNFSDAREIINAAASKEIPVFVDTKRNNVSDFAGAFAIFLNDVEYDNISGRHSLFNNVIHKQGHLGCRVNEIEVRSKNDRPVFDVTGAGDVFLAAFVARYLHYGKTFGLIECASYANLMAGISVRHVGTYILRPEDLK